MIDGERIVVQGDLVELQELRTIRQVPLNEWLQRINVTTPVTLPTIGRTQVFAHYDGTAGGVKRFFILSEIPAAIRSIEKNIGNSARRYRLAFPHTYIWFVAETAEDKVDRASCAINEYRCFHARDRYNGIDTEMVVAFVPNIYGDGRICWGATGVDPGMTLADRIDKLTNEWYLSRFNTDLDGYTHYPRGAANFRDWVIETREGGASIYRNWPEWTDPNVTKYTVRRLLEEHGVTPTLTNIVLPNEIPAVETNMTFGRWDEWWTSLDPQQRTRAQISLGNLALDDPENLPELEETPEDSDDGGVEIEYR